MSTTRHSLGAYLYVFSPRKFSHSKYRFLIRTAVFLWVNWILFSPFAYNTFPSLIWLEFDVIYGLLNEKTLILFGFLYLFKSFFHIFRLLFSVYIFSTFQRMKIINSYFFLHFHFYSTKYQERVFHYCRMFNLIRSLFKNKKKMKEKNEMKTSNLTMAIGKKLNLISRCACFVSSTEYLLNYRFLLVYFFSVVYE